MVGLFGRSSQADTTPAYTGIDLQTSALGVTIAVLKGRDRVVPQLIDYDDFKAKKGKAPGGKGGLFGGGKGGYLMEYSATVLMALGNGPIVEILKSWNGKSSTVQKPTGMTLFTGEPGQVPWSHMVTHHPEKALAYPGTAYLAAADLPLGQTPTLGNYSFEVSSGPGAYGDEADLAIADICEAMLTDLGFEALGSFTAWHDYGCALGLIGSLYLREQMPIRDTLARLAKSSNAEWLWTGGALVPVPLGDENVTGNGFSWTAPSAAVAALGYGDFVEARGRAPVELERSRASDIRNVVKIEWKDRANDYNTQPTEVMDDASIAQIGRRPAQVVTAHHWKKPEPALLSAQFELQAMARRNTYRTKLDPRHCLLEPLDLVTLADPLLDEAPIPARLQRVSIDPDGTVSVVAKEYTKGLGIANAYAFDVADRYGANYNAPAPAVAEPYLFEPPAILTDGARQLWIAVTGPGDNWGGCEVHVSDDGTSYRLVDTITGSARYGELLDALPVATSPDTTNTPQVDLTVSEGELQSGTISDATALNTLSMIGAELVAYETADLVAPHVYELGYIVRGARGTAIASHAIGAKFVRLDENIATFDFDETRVGATIYLKFVSFNPMRGGRQDISDVVAYPVTLTGSSFSVDAATAAAVAELEEQIDQMGGFRAIGDITVGAPITLSGASWQTLRSIDVEDLAAGGISWAGTTIRSSVVDGMSGGASMTASFRITHEPTTGGAAVTLVTGTLTITASAGQISAVTVNTTDGDYADLTYTGDVTFRLQVQRSGGATSQTGIVGSLKGTFSP